MRHLARIMRHLDVFSGIGGFALAAYWTGKIETVGFCEIDDYCGKILNKNFPGVPVHADIKTLKNEGQYGTIDIITGGFPCQPFSVAGKQQGKEDNRYLWPEMLRVIQEFKPSWVLGENVTGIINMELDTVLSDLEKEDYEVQPIIIPACAKDAPHRRDRVWILAYTNRNGLPKRNWENTRTDETRKNQNRKRKTNPNISGCPSKIISNTNEQGLEGKWEKCFISKEKYESIKDCRWESESGICRVANGISKRVQT